MLAKLGLRDRVHAVVLAYESRLITPDTHGRRTQRAGPTRQQSARAARVPHRGAAVRRRPCCSTEIIASVDSAPWLRPRLVGPRPSPQPPVRSSNSGILASLSPRNHATLIFTPANQLLSPVTVAARMHASASAATSIGCWSKAGRTSPGLQPPTGTTDR